MSYTPTEWESTDVVTATRLNALEQAVGDLNMSYTPNVWQNGDILTADKMNALEQAVASGGGGGDSDLSTATVTVINDTGATNITFNSAPYIAEENGLGEGSPATVYSELYFEEETEQILTVPLYKGCCMWNTDAWGTVNCETTGDISVLGVFIVITGNGTITIS